MSRVIKRKADLLFTRKPYCNRCGMRAQVRSALTCDHIMPLWMGGTNVLSNLQLLCKRCHKAKNKIEAKASIEMGINLDPLHRLKGEAREAARQEYVRKMGRENFGGKPVEDKDFFLWESVIAPCWCSCCRIDCGCQRSQVCFRRLCPCRWTGG